MKILGIDNIVLDVTDLDSARRFYGVVLGLSEDYAFPERGVVGYRIGDERPGLVVRLTSGENGPQARAPRIWLEVENAAVAAEELRTRGVALLGVPIDIGTGRVVEIQDPFGHVIGLADYTTAPALGRGSSVGAWIGDKLGQIRSGRRRMG